MSHAEIRCPMWQARGDHGGQMVAPSAVCPLPLCARVLVHGHRIMIGERDRVLRLFVSNRSYQ